MPTEHELLERKNEEIGQEINVESRGEEYEAHIRSLEGTKRGLKHWLQHSDEIDPNTLTPENLIEFKDLATKQIAMLDTQAQAYEDVTRHMVDAFNRGRIELKDLTRGTKAAYNQLYLTNKLRAKAVYMLTQAQ